MSTTTSTTAQKRPARAPRRFTAVHNLPANKIDIASTLAQLFGPALLQAAKHSKDSR
jgi:hypothetical protein